MNLRTTKLLKVGGIFTVPSMDVFCHIIPLTLITQDDRLTTGAWAARLVFPWPVGNETET